MDRDTQYMLTSAEVVEIDETIEDKILDELDKIRTDGELIAESE